MLSTTCPKPYTTATITTVLLKKGLRNVWVRGARPIRSGQKRLVGPAFTLRFVPVREDLATPESWGNPISTRAAVEAMPEGAIAVIDAMGVTDAGVFGDILCARMAKRNVAAMVTDGVVRDLAGVLSTKLPIWCAGVAAPSSVTGLTFVNWAEPIGCGGVQVRPEDIIGCDDDGVVAVPLEVAQEVAIHARAVLLADMKGRRGLYERLGMPMDETVDVATVERYYEDLDQELRREG